METQQSLTLGEYTKQIKSEIDFIYPEQAFRKMCPRFGYPCKANKCMGWVKAPSEQDVVEIRILCENKKYKDIWDGKTGGNPKLLKKIEQKKYKMDRKFFDWNDNQILIAWWIKKKKRRKGYCLVINNNIRNQ